MKIGICMVLIALGCSVVILAQEKSPIPDPPSISMAMVQSVLAEKDSAMNAKSLELVQATATIDQLKKVILDKDAELKKAQADKKCE